MGFQLVCALTPPGVLGATYTGYSHIPHRVERIYFLIHDLSSLTNLHMHLEISFDSLARPFQKHLSALVPVPSHVQQILDKLLITNS